MSFHAALGCLSTLVAAAWAAAAVPAADSLTESSAAQWSASADGATASVSNDTTHVKVGSSSLKFLTTGGFDTWLWSPPAKNASWDLLASGGPSFWVYAVNTNSGFQNNGPWIILGSSPGNYARYQPNREILNEARNQWVQVNVPLNGDATWTRTDTGSPNLHNVQWMEIHGDTWEAGFTLYIDGLAFDTGMSGPEGVSAVALNNAVRLKWKLAFSFPSAAGYRIYRDTVPFTSIAGRTPLTTVPSIGIDTYTDNTAVNGTSYYYAVSVYGYDGGESTKNTCVGPLTPRNETDLQVVSISRTPRFPRYAPNYSWYTMSEPSGFGPYGFSAATSLGNGQTPATQRWPNIGQQVTYTAMVRNRGTTTWNTTLQGTWQIDGVAAGGANKSVNLAPGQSTTVTLIRNWDGQLHDITFTLTNPDGRADNNGLTVSSKSVPFLTYVDESYAEAFREESSGLPQADTIDVIDWLNLHMTRFNQMFAEKGSPKRVHYDLLEVIADQATDPNVDTMPFAIFPFRFRATDGSLRGSGYYSPIEDLDFGLLHEMGHQLGLVDLYRMDLSGDVNKVSGLGYSAPACLMNGCSPFLSDHSAAAMTHWLDDAHGYYGQYMYNMPEQIKLRILDFAGQPLEGATVKMYQLAERPGEGQIISTQIKAQGTTDASGEWLLPNVPIDTALVPPVLTGDTLFANPFGYLAVIATNGVLHFRVEYGGGVDYAWLDITEANMARFNGITDVAVFERQLGLGGSTQWRPPTDLAELNASDWSAWAQGSNELNTFAVDDTSRRNTGDGSVKLVTDGGFDTYLRYPRSFIAQWNLSAATRMRISFYATNPNGSFQNASPWIRLKDADNNYFEYQYYSNGSPIDLLNQALGVWRTYDIPLNPGTPHTGWRRTSSGTPSLAKIQYVEIHADTWGGGFNLWVDGINFDVPLPIKGDLNADQAVDAADLELFVECQTGPAVGPIGTGCSAADIDADQDVDASDFAVFQQCYGPAGSLRPTGCR